MSDYNFGQQPVDQLQHLSRSSNCAVIYCTIWDMPIP